MRRISIVGGGVLGTSIAYHLRDAPVEVTLFERDALGSGTTAASMAVFHWQSLQPTALGQRLRRRAWAEYERFVEDGALEFDRTGALHVTEYRQDLSKLEAAADALRAHDLDATVLEPDALEAFGIAPEAVAGGLYTPEEGHFDPAAVVEYYAERATSEGVSIRTGTTVSDVRVEDGTVVGVETDAGGTESDVVINAAGPWAPDLNAAVGVSLPLRRTRGPILDLRTESGVDLPFTLFESDDRSPQYLRAHRDGAYAGRYATAYEEGGDFDPDADHAVDDAFHGDVDDLLATTVPALADATVADEWVGLRTVTPDGLPAVGETEVEGFVVACGPSGVGVTLAPAIGDLLATALTTDRSPADFEALAPDRFATQPG